MSEPCPRPSTKGCGCRIGHRWQQPDPQLISRCIDCDASMIDSMTGVLYTTERDEMWRVERPPCQPDTGEASAP